MKLRYASTCVLVLLLAGSGLPAWADDGPGRGGPTDKEKAAELIAAMKDKKPEIRAKAALAAAELQHESLVSPLLRLLSDVELGVREAATKALATRTDRKAKKRAAAALNPRIARFARRTSDQYELLVVVDALRQLAQPSSVKPLLDGIQWDDPAEVARARILAVGSIPHADSVERLIQFMDRGRKGQSYKNVAHQALMYLTGANHKRNPDQWRAWWRENEKTFDFAAVVAAREAAEAEKAAKAAARKARQEEARRKKEERRRKDKKKPPPAPDGDAGGVDD